MSDLATALPAHPAAAAILDKKMKKSHAIISGGVVLAALAIGLGFIGVNIFQDFNGVAIGSIWPYLLLIFALLIALGFEFVNGFHDTANAVATVIYTPSIPTLPWSGPGCATCAAYCSPRERWPSPSSRCSPSS